MKRLVAIAGAGAMLLAVVTPAFAAEDHGFKPVAPVTSLTNSATVSNAASATSSTGGNVQQGGGYMWTGNAGSVANAVVVANTTVVVGGKLPTNIANAAYVENYAAAVSATGGNVQSAPTPSRGDRSERPTSLKLFTGDAGSTSNAWSVVNTTVSWK